MQKKLSFSFWVGMTMLLEATFSSGAPSHKAPDFKVLIQQKKTSLEIVAIPPPLHHCNLKAPLFLAIQGKRQKIKPYKATDHEIRFRINSPQSGDYEIEIYLCDDAETYCERHQVTTHWDSKTSTSTAQSGRSTDAALITPRTPEKHIDHFGFKVNMPKEALSEAKNQSKPLLIDFFGIWCPPCNELDEEVFSTDEFKDQSSRFVKLKLDADSDISWTLKSKYKVGGYPTVIFASSTGEEIDRIVGFRNKKTFLRYLNDAWDARNQPLSQLLSEAKSGNINALDRLGIMHLRRKEYSQAMEMLEKSTKEREKYFEALIGNLEEKSEKDEKNKIDLITALETSIQEFPNTPESIDRRSQLASLYQEKGNIPLQKDVLNKLILVAHQWIAQSPARLEEHDMTHADLWSMIAEAQELLGNSKEASHAWRQAILEYQNKIKTGQERGYHLEMAYCLWKSGDFTAAEKIYQRFEKQYPNEFTFYFNHASMKMAQKQWVDAEQISKKALRCSYGDNQLRAAYLLAKALKAQGKNTQSKAILEQTLQSAKIPADQNIRTHRYVKQIMELMKET